MPKERGRKTMGRMVAVKELVPGDILSDAVLSMAGKVLLGKDISLTQRHISLLNSWEIQNVFIEGAADTTVAETAAAPAAGKTEETDGAARFKEFIDVYAGTVGQVAESFSFIKQSRIVPVTHLKNTAGDIHDSICANRFGVMNYLLAGSFAIEHLISRHSVMVAYLASVLAQQMKWEEKDVRGVALAGLLHDIGNLITTNGKGGYQESHLADTAKLLKSAAGLPGEVILGIIQHREHFDGTGFPSGTKGQQIHPYARILSVADRFHNLAYVGEHANPFPILDILKQEMYVKFDADICHTFILKLKDSLTLNRVLLSDGKEAEVIFFNRDSYRFPVVKTVENDIIDLSQRKDLGIQQIILSTK